jgi:hypothetical protein
VNVRGLIQQITDDGHTVRPSTVSESYPEKANESVILRDGVLKDGVAKAQYHTEIGEPEGKERPVNLR